MFVTVSSPAKSPSARLRAAAFVVVAAQFVLACRSGTAARSVSQRVQAVHETPAVSVPTGTGRPLPHDPAVVEGTLANGLHYYVRKNAKPEKRAELWLAVNAGSVVEGDDQRGIAHFVEHMAFNGTRKYAKQRIVDWLEKTGMKFGADVNASTTFDETVYQLQVPTDDPTLVDHGLDILHEWAQGIAFDAAEVDRERGVILEERRLHRGAEGRLLDAIIPAALPGSRYGHRLPIGSENIIRTAKHGDLERFYRDWYRPDLMAVIVVGDIDPAMAQKQIQQRFGDLSSPGPTRPRLEVAVPPHDKPITLVVKDPELPVTLVAVASKQPRRIIRSEDDLRAAFTDELFTAMLNQRLTELGQKPDAAFLAAVVGRAPILRPIDVWYQGAVVKGERAEEALTAVAAELARVARFGFTDTEVARARQELLHALEVRAKERDKTESRSYASDLVRGRMSGDAMPGVDATLVLASKLVPTITVGQITAVSARAASAQNRVVIALGNQGAKLPQEARLLAVMAAGAAKATTAYIDDAGIGPLVATAPRPGKIASEHQITELGVTEWILANGIRVVLKPTDFQNDEVRIAGFVLGGSSLASDTDFVAAQSAAELVEASGAGSLSASQLTRALSGTGVNLRVGVETHELRFSGNGSPAHLDALFQLLYVRLTQVRKDEQAIAAWRAQQVEARARQLDDPDTAFRARFIEAATSKQLRTRLLTSADFAGLDADRALAFYRDRFASVAGLTVVVVGNFQLDRIKPLVVTYLGGISTAGKAEHWHDIKIRRPRGAVTVNVTQGIDPKARVRLLFHRHVPWSLQAEHDLVALAAALSIRLREELRENMSGTYGVAVDGAFSREPRPEATLEIELGCAPEAVEPLLARTRQIIASFKKDGPPAEVIDKIKQTERRERQTNLKTNAFWLNLLVEAHRFGDDARTAFVERDRLIDGLSVARLVAAAKRYLGSDEVLGVLRPATRAPDSTTPNN